jgi:hypothetical protein
VVDARWLGVCSTIKNTTIISNQTRGQCSKTNQIFVFECFVYHYVFETTREGLIDAITGAEECVDAVRKWLGPNHLKGNDGKTDFAILASKQRMSRLQPLPDIRIGSATIRPSAKVKNLGAQSTFKYTVSRVCRHLDDVTCARVMNA